MFVTNWISTTKIQKISEITNFFRHYFLSRTEVGFILSPVDAVSNRFTKIFELSTSGFNVLLHAKRNGQWWILKSLKPDVSYT